MDLSIFIAKILALVYLAVGLGMIFSAKYYSKLYDDFLKNPGVMYLGGIMALVIGYLIITYHNIWIQSWIVLVTVVGWLAFIKGVMLLVFPEKMISFTTSIINKNKFATLSIVPLILGVIFAYFGFFV